MTPRALLTRFWLEPAAPDGLAFLRISVALVALVQLAILWPHLPALYGNYGFVQWIVTEAGNSTWFPSLGKLALTLSTLGFAWKTVLYGVFGLYGLSLVSMGLGFWSRLSAGLACAAHALTLNNGYFSVYGMDTMLHILLFYLTFFPSGATASVDALRGKGSPLPSASARVALRVLQLHLCIIYLNTGLAKAQGDQWWTGDALWRAVMQPQFGAFDFAWLARFPEALRVACWGVLLVETGYAFAIWVRPLRKPWLLATMALHAGIALSMRLWLFSITMIIFNLAAYFFVREAPARVKVPVTTRPSPAFAPY